jgi:dihydrofolate synthase/folylpolyglutamate synthase
MHFSTLNQWLNWQVSLHFREIDLGLARVKMVAQRLNLLPPPFPIITVAGTNGKGSSVILLDAILSAANYRIGRYTSPHLLRYNERICIAGMEASDAQICHAFELIEQVRGDISLTFFEFGTLAAMLVFRHGEVDLAVLEVGLGGRLDAVNIFDPIIALVTAIDIDHVEWLGNDRESIGFEKAGIFRAQRPAVCSDTHPPQSLIQYAEQLQTRLYCLGRDFIYSKKSDQVWSLQMINSSSGLKDFFHLPLPGLFGDFQLQNAAGALMVVELLRNESSDSCISKERNFLISDSAIHQGLVSARLLGRFQVLPGRVTRILDVAHNPKGAQVLAELLRQTTGFGATHAVVGLLKDKDIAGVFNEIQGCITDWHVATLDVPRGASAECLMEHLMAIGVNKIDSYSSITEAYGYLLSHAKEGDRIVVFGSFYTVAEVLSVEMS